MPLVNEQHEFELFVHGSVDDATRSNPPTAPRVQSLPLTSLSWQTFEQLCCRYVQHEREIEGVPHLFGVPGDRQRGIDIVAFKRTSSGTEKWCFQCKNYDALPPGRLRQAIAALDYDADHYVIILAGQAKAELRTIVEEHSGRVELWDGQDLSWKLKYHPDLVAEFFHPAWVEVFCVQSSMQSKQTGSIHGDAYFVPQPDATFVGRESELARVRSAVRDLRLVVVKGIGGIGKTQLLLQALQGVDETHTLWLNLEGYQTLDELKFACSSAVIQRTGLVQEGPEPWFTTLNQNLRLFLDGLDRIAISQLDEVCDFLSLLLMHSPHLHLVISTQLELDLPDVQGLVVQLGPLTQNNALNLLETLVGQQGDVVFPRTEQAHWLVQFCEGHPLSLRIVAGLLGFFKDVHVVVSRLQSRGASELRNPSRRTQKRSTSLQVCLSAAYSALSHGQQCLLYYLACFPDGCIAVQAETWYEEGDFQSDLATVRRFYFVSSRQDSLDIQRLHILSPIRQFIREDWERDAPQESNTIRMSATESLSASAAVLASKYLESSSADDVEWGLARFDSDFSNFLSGLTHVQQDLARRRSEGIEVSHDVHLILIHGFALSLQKYCFIRGLLATGLQLTLLGARAAEELGDMNDVAYQYQFAAALQSRLGDRAGLEKTVADIAALVERNGEKDQQLIAISLYIQGKLASADEHFEESAAFYEAAISKLRELLPNERGSTDSTYAEGLLILSLGALGILYEHFEVFKQALECHLEARERALAIGDFINLGNCCHQIGNCYSSLGQFDEALNAYKQALDVFLRLGHAEHISNSMAEIAFIALELGVDATVEEFLTEVALERSLDDVLSEAIRFVDMCMHGSMHEGMVKSRASAILRNLYLIVELAGLTSKTHVLTNWAALVLDYLETSEVEFESVSSSLKQRAQVAGLMLIWIQGAALLAHQIGETALNFNEREIQQLVHVVDQVSGMLPEWADKSLNTWLAVYLGQAAH
jgi:tetratricopeptide (TPR) repeat protein